MSADQKVERPLSMCIASAMTVLSALRDRSPRPPMGEPEDITQAILYLEEASFVTGEILHVDGGQIAGH